MSWIKQIDTSLVQPLERRLLGKTFLVIIEKFYENQNNLHRFKEWQKERKEKQKK